MTPSDLERCPCGGLPKQRVELRAYDPTGPMRDTPDEWYAVVVCPDCGWSMSQKTEEFPGQRKMKLMVRFFVEARSQIMCKEMVEKMEGAEP